ncbi:hypothetical protein J4471_03495 [Candidatus Woesearchaeota archaeon]|nr:hypothetical protein [Candidatus Woesearchaeota archaeon]
MPIDDYLGKLEGVRLSKNIANPLPSFSNQYLKTYIILEGKDYGDYHYSDLLISMKRSNYNLNWFDAHHALDLENSYMLHLKQFVDFLNLLLSGKAFDGNGSIIGQHILEKILEDIILIREPWRGEWLDADFKVDVNSKKMIINYNHALRNQSLLSRHSAIIEDYLGRRRSQGISFKEWLSNSTVYGLPPKKIKSGDLEFWPPLKSCKSAGQVAMWAINGVGVRLNCIKNPDFLFTNLGVRRVKIKE